LSQLIRQLIYNPAEFQASFLNLPFFISCLMDVPGLKATLTPVIFEASASPGESAGLPEAWSEKVPKSPR
jgi:hypothetical protein